MDSPGFRGATSDIGRLVVRHTQPWWHVVLAVVVVFAFAAQFGYIGLYLGAPLALLLVYSMTRAVNVYEHGVESGSIFRKSRLFYVDVASFSYRQTQYSGGAAGLQTNMRLWDGKKVVDIKAASLGGDSDANLEALRNHLTELLATRFIESIASGETVAWGDSLTISQKGVCDKKGKIILPVDQSAACKIIQGECFLFVPNEKKARLKLNCSEPNFLPGYAALATVFQRAGASLTHN